jgi:hypothetical protein
MDVLVNYTEKVLNEEGRLENTLFQIRGSVFHIEDCTDAINETQARILSEELQKNIQNQAKIAKAAANVLQTFQLLLVEVEPGIRFWYLFKHCDPDHLNKVYQKYESSILEGYSVGIATKSFSEEGRFVLRNIPRKIDGKWDPQDIEFHNQCTQLNDEHPGTLSTLSNWILYGMAATALRDFSIVEDLLMSPHINRPDLIETFYNQYTTDLENLIKIAAPLGTDVVVYRGASEYNTLIGNFNVDTILATTNDPNIPLMFVNSYNKMKQFIIPAKYPVVDLRPFNPQEREIVLLPPLSFELVQQRKLNPQSSNNINIYRINQKQYWFANNVEGGAKTRKQKKRRQTKRSKPSKH